MNTASFRIELEKVLGPMYERQYKVMAITGPSEYPVQYCGEPRAIVNHDRVLGKNSLLIHAVNSSPLYICVGDVINASTVDLIRDVVTSATKRLIEIQDILALSEWKGAEVIET